MLTTTVPLIITIDGGAATGASTVAARLRDKFIEEGYEAQHINTGSMYRALTCLAIDQNGFIDSIDWSVGISQTSLVLEASKRSLTFVNGRAAFNGMPFPEEALKARGVNEAVPKLAEDPIIRGYVNDRTREAAQFIGIVFVDGRASGTEVFPNAILKFFLSVKVKEAAKRSGANPGQITQRDRADKKRKVAPMEPAENAIPVDTTGKDEDQVFDELYQHVGKALDAMHSK